MVQRGHEDVGDEGIDAVLVAGASELGAQRILVEGEDGVEDAPTTSAVRMSFVCRSIVRSTYPADLPGRGVIRPVRHGLSLFAVRCLPEPRVSRLVA